MKMLLLVALAVFGLAGCAADSTYVDVGDPPDNVTFDGHLRVGQKLDVAVTVDHPEIEGSSQLPAISLQTSDLGIVRTEPGGHGFFLYGVAPGTATIHATTDGFPEADFVVTVEAP